MTKSTKKSLTSSSPADMNKPNSLVQKLCCCFNKWNSQLSFE